MREHDLDDKVVRSLLDGSATAPEIAEALATSEINVLPVLHRLRGDDVVEFMGGNWSLSEKFRSRIERQSLSDQKLCVGCRQKSSHQMVSPCNTSTEP
jgi:hypothetical protein